MTHANVQLIAGLVTSYFTYVTVACDSVMSQLPPSFVRLRALACPLYQSVCLFRIDGRERETKHKGRGEG